ncbi:RHS repeat-associated core domain-containing protein [Nonomuraea sp. NPDC050790]|uniref:RHS repeat-associated core domain-containing protein n=1 Tax=Nonomuraea sp. NPDC050790 TaxID=3364371 RepID=UPI0037B44874
MVLSADGPVRRHRRSGRHADDLHGVLVATFTGSTLTTTAAYDPLGTVTERTGAHKESRLPTEYTDPGTGKTNMHACWYQPGTGAFTSRDTVTLTPNPSVQANRHTYANAFPLTGIDPTGLEDGYAGYTGDPCGTSGPIQRCSDCGSTSCSSGVLSAEARPGRSTSGPRTTCVGLPHTTRAGAGGRSVVRGGAGWSRGSRRAIPRTRPRSTRRPRSASRSSPSR